MTGPARFNTSVMILETAGAQTDDDSPQLDERRCAVTLLQHEHTLAEHDGHTAKGAKKPMDMPPKGSTGKPAKTDPHAGHDMSKAPKPGTSTKGGKK